MEPVAVEVKELLYEVAVSFTQVLDHGFSLDALVGGTTPLPPAGVRLDIAFEGRL